MAGRTVLEKTGPVSYKVQVGDRIWRRHVDQLLSTKSDNEELSPSDDYVHTAARTEPTRQNEEQHLLKGTLILKLHRTNQMSLNLQTPIQRLQLELLVILLELIIPLNIFVSLISSFLMLEEM